MRTAGRIVICYLNASAALDDPMDTKRTLDRLTAAKQDAAGRRCLGLNALARRHAQLFQSLMAGEDWLRG